MRQTLHIQIDSPVTLLTEGVVYAQRITWCGAAVYPLKLSLMRPRANFSYDVKRKSPVIVFLCGGSFAEMNRNVWLPELTYFAKHGFAVASVDYTVSQMSRYLEQPKDIADAIAYLRLHADELSLDGDKIVVLGESAGGYLSILTALEQSVSACAALYPVTDPAALPHPELLPLPRDIGLYPSLPSLVYRDEPAVLLLHGTADTLVPCEQSVMLYDAMRKVSARAELYLVEEANHADHHFVQDSVKHIMLDFFHRYTDN